MELTALFQAAAALLAPQADPLSLPKLTPREKAALVVPLRAASPA